MHLAHQPITLSHAIIICIQQHLCFCIILPQKKSITAVETKGFFALVYLLYDRGGPFVHLLRCFLPQIRKTNRDKCPYRTRPVRILGCKSFFPLQTP